MEARAEKVARQEWWREVIEIEAGYHSLGYKEYQPFHLSVFDDEQRIDIYPQLRKWINVTRKREGTLDQPEKIVELFNSQKAKLDKDDFAQFKKNRKIAQASPPKKKRGLLPTSKYPVGKYKGTPMKDVPEHFLLYVVREGYCPDEVVDYVNGYVEKKEVSPEQSHMKSIYREFKNS